ncbi:MAG TPA: DinB family protein [Bryobacteraceae bacterium]
MLIRDALLPEFDQEMATTRRLLERIPDDKFSFKPHPKSMDMASLATHLSEMTNWTTETIGKDSIDLASFDPSTRKIAASRAELLKMFDTSVANARAALATVEDAQLMQPWSLKSGEKVFFTMPKVAVLRTFVFNHCVHHRGQLSVYLRLNDIPVPAIYGPSADEPGMM